MFVQQNMFQWGRIIPPEKMKPIEIILPVLSIANENGHTVEDMFTVRMVGGTVINIIDFEGMDRYFNAVNLSNTDTDTEIGVEVICRCNNNSSSVQFFMPDTPNTPNDIGIFIVEGHQWWIHTALLLDADLADRLNKAEYSWNPEICWGRERSKLDLDCPEGKIIAVILAAYDDFNRAMR